MVGICVASMFYIEHLRVLDAAPAIEPLLHLRPLILSQPIAFRRMCHYQIEFDSNSRLRDEVISDLMSLNHLPSANSLDLIILTPKVTDKALPTLLRMTTVDILDVRESAISDKGIAQLTQALTKTSVLTRK